MGEAAAHSAPLGEDFWGKPGLGASRASASISPYEEEGGCPSQEEGPLKSSQSEEQIWPLTPSGVSLLRQFLDLSCANCWSAEPRTPSRTGLRTRVMDVEKTPSGLDGSTLQALFSVPPTW